MARVSGWSTRQLACLLVATLAALVAAGPAGAQDSGGESIELNVKGNDGGGDYWFEVEGQEGQNPTINLPPGAEVTVNFENVGDQPHNFVVGDPVGQGTEIIFSGESESITFTVPEDASGETEYWCDPHRDLGMAGTVSFQAADGGGNGGGGNNTDGTGNGGGDGSPDETTNDGIPGFGAGLMLVALAVALVLGAVARGAGRRR